MDKDCLKKLLKLNKKERFFDEESIRELCKDTELNKEQLMHTALFLVLCFWQKIENKEDEIKRINKDKGLLEAQYEIIKEREEELKVTIKDQELEIKEIKKSKEVQEEKVYTTEGKDSYIEYAMIVKNNTIDCLRTKVRRLTARNDVLNENRYELITVLRKQSIENKTLKQQLKDLEADIDLLRNKRNATNNELRVNRMSNGRKTAYNDKASIEVILAYKKQGLSNERIGQVLGVSRYTVGRRIKKSLRQEQPTAW